MSETITRKDVIAWAMGEMRPYLKRGYATYTRSTISSVIMKARDEFPGYQMDANDPDTPAHVRQLAPLADSEAHQHVQQLERLNATLAAQIDRQAKVVDVALALAKSLRLTTDWTPEEAALEYAARAYQQAMAQLAKEG